MREFKRMGDAVTGGIRPLPIFDLISPDVQLTHAFRLSYSFHLTLIPHRLRLEI